MATVSAVNATNDTTVDDNGLNVESNTIEKNMVSNEVGNTSTTYNNSINNTKISTTYNTNTDNSNTAINTTTSVKTNATRNISNNKLSSSSPAVITVEPVSTEINSVVKFNATVKYANGTGINGELVAFKINGNTIGTARLSNGAVSLTHNLSGLSAKIYNLTVKIGDGRDFLSSSKNTTLSVFDLHNTTTSTESITFVKKGNSVILSANVYSNGSAITGGRAGFYVNGKSIGIVNVIKGVANITYDSKSLAAGNYNVSVYFRGSVLYSPSNTTGVLRVQNSLQTFTQSQVFDAANRTVNFIENNHALPNYVVIGSQQVVMNDVLYLFAQATISKSSLSVGGFTNKTTSTTANYNEKLYKSHYVDLAEVITKCYALNSRAPNVINSSLGTLSIEDAIYLFARVNAYTYNNKALPEYAVIKAVGYTTSSGNSSNVLGTSESTVNKTKTVISTQALFFVKNNGVVELSATVKANGSLLSTGNVTFVVNGTNIGTAKLSGGVASINYTSKLANGNYNIAMTYQGSKTYDVSSTTSVLRVQSSLMYYSLNQIGAGAQKVVEYIEANGSVPNYVTLNSTKVYMNDYLYLLSQSLISQKSLYGGNFDTAKSGVTTKTDVKVYSSEYLKIANTIVSCYAKNYRAPNNITTSFGSMSFNDTVYLFARVVAYNYKNKELPNYAVISTVKPIKSTTVTSTQAMFFVKKSGVVELSATIKANGSLLSSGNVTFVVNGTTIGTAKVSGGVASINYASKLANGNYKVNMTYQGDKTYNASSATSVLRVQSSLTQYSLNQIGAGAQKVVEYIEANGSVPNYVTLNSTKVYMNDYLYLLSQSLISQKSLCGGNFDTAKSGVTTKTDVKVYSSEYLKIANTIVSCYATNYRAPNNITTSFGSMSFNDTVYAFARVVAYNYKNKELPNYVVVKATKAVSSAAVTANTTKCATVTSTQAMFFVKKNGVVELSANVKNVNGSKVYTGSVEFVVNGKVVGTAKVSSSVASVNYTSNLALGNYNIKVNYKGSSTCNNSSTTSVLRVQSSLTYYSLNQIGAGAQKVVEYIEKNGTIPNYVTLNSNKVYMKDYLYLLSQSLISQKSLYGGNFDSAKDGVTTKTNVNIYKSEYLKIASTIVSSYAKNSRAPNNITTSYGSMSFNDTVYLFARVVAYNYKKGDLPNYAVIKHVTPSSSSGSSSSNSSGSSSSNSSSSTTVPSGYSQYLVESTNCQVSSSVIKNLAKEITSGISGTYEKAVAIFKYLNNKTDYSYYANTRRGALQTWSDRTGNCVDLSHLFIAVARAANIPARYAHGHNCVFRSGLVSGHVWAEVYANGKWYSCDISSNYNSFGNIVNWNSCSSIDRYISLPF